MRAGADFTADRRLLLTAATAALVGAAGAAAAVLLFRLICFFTNLFFYQRPSLAISSPADNALGLLAVAPPIVGGIVVGLIARYGSERIRGHGIPEAMEAILVGQSRMEPKVAVLKPLSSAIAIGSGGPFGAEGPIIMTGGAIGSIVGQGLHVTAAERKTLLVAGAAAGMSATFGTPVAAVLLAVELLLFEWKPRSFVPVAVASAVAAALRPHFFPAGPLFPVPATPPMDLAALAACVPVGLIAGFASALLTWGVYAAEDAFGLLPLHWSWWPALGGLVVGIGGLLEPRALGVGYAEIERLVAGHGAGASVAMLMLVKAIVWIVALSSGTSGGVLAPLLMMGSALGALEAPYLPSSGAALWPLVSLAAIMGGTMRSPLTAVVFAVELTQETSALLPTLVACTAAHGFTVLVMRRSILTEKVARRGYHLSREYSVDPLEALTVSEVMSGAVETVPAELAASDLAELFAGSDSRHKGHQGYPVVGADGRLVGVVTRSSLLDRSASGTDVGPLAVGDLVDRTPVVAFADESCRTAAERMAGSGVGRLPVVERADPGRVVGIVSRSDLLKARARALELEQRRERVLRRPRHTAAAAVDAAAR